MHDRRKLGFTVAMLLVTGYWLLVTPVFATEYSSTSYKVIDPVFNESSGEMTSSSYRLRGVLGELAPARSTATSYILRSGSLGYPAPAAAASSGSTTAPPTSPPPPETVVRDVGMSGRAYANSTVSLFQNGSVVRTVVAGTDGIFSGTIQNVAGGTYTFGASARDASGRASVLLTYTITVAGSQVTIANIFLSPTVELSSSSVTKGQAITAKGVAFPASTVRVQIPSNPDLTSMANSIGDWSVAIDTTGLAVGSYSLRARSEVSGQASELGTPLTFTVAAVPAPPAPPAPTCRGGDLNDTGKGDGKVNSQDVSILLSFWKKTSFTSNPCTDTNRDGAVNLRDLSILLFSWTG